MREARRGRDEGIRGDARAIQHTEMQDEECRICLAQHASCDRGVSEYGSLIAPQ